MKKQEINVINVVEVILIIVSAFIAVGLPWWTGVTFFIVANVFFFSISLTEVPALSWAMITLWGKPFVIHENGLKLIVPKIMKVDALLTQKEHYFQTFEGKANLDDLVEFQESSAYVIGGVFLKIVDPYKFTYDVENGYEAVKDIFRALLRNYAEDRPLNDLKSSKDLLSLTALFECRNRDESETEQEYRDSYKNHPLYYKMWHDWGIEVVSFYLGDLILSEEDEKARQEIFTAKLAKKKADYEGQATLTTAQYAKKSEQERAKGHKALFVALNAQGLSAEEAKTYLTEMKKWDKLSSQANVILNEGNSSSGMGNLSPEEFALRVKNYFKPEREE